MDYLVDRTVVFIDNQPDDCEETYYEGERLLYCDGTLYRPSYHKDKRIYEIIDPDPEEDSDADSGTSMLPAPAEQKEAPSGEEIIVSEGAVLKLQVPRMVGPYVSKVQSALRNGGFIIDDRDGTYGTGTNLAVKTFQVLNSLAPSGEVDSVTAQKLGL